ncbi:MAG: TrkH family potassium uptake protein [Spirochaetes bacterium]|nr:TrkH family potassium uptake protein [Spirochaetota bacterium]
MKMRLSRDKVIIFSYFIGIILAGALLLSLPFSWNGEKPLAFLDALFTATSAVCVTGLAVVDTSQYSDFGLTVIMALIQLGGLGIVVFATIYVTSPRRKISLVGRGMIKDLYLDDVETNPKKIIRTILVATFAFEGTGALLLYARFRRVAGNRALFVSAFHAISAFCNAGFSTFSSNLEDFVTDPVITLTISTLIIAGGIGFMVFQDVARLVLGRRRHLAYHTRLVLMTTFALIIVGTAFFYVVEYRDAYRSLTIPQKFLAAFFQAVTPRTAGFDTVPQFYLSPASVMFVMVLMFIGGSPGSTAGGIKTTTFLVGVLTAFRQPDEKNNINVVNRAIPTAIVLKSFSIIGKALTIIGISAFSVLLFEGNLIAADAARFVQLIFETISAFGTVGLSLGVTFTLTAGSKIVLILTMFAGRVGLFTMVLPSRNREIERFADFPRENLLIG